MRRIPKSEKEKPAKLDAGEEEPKEVVDDTPAEPKSKHYRVKCHTQCFWLNVLWDVGDIYDGHQKPPKHFSVDGRPPAADPQTRKASEDPRSTAEMRLTLRKTFGVEVPEDLKRAEIYEVLRKHEATVAGKKSIKSN